MEENIVQIKRIDSIKLKLVDEQGEATGEYLYVKVKDVEAPIRFQNMIDETQRIGIELRDKLKIIEKQQDHEVKGKIFTAKQQAQYDALKEYFDKRTDVYNMFLGENGVQKLLNGQQATWDTFEWIDEVIEKQILPHIDMTFKGMTDKIREKYKVNIKENDVLE